MLKWNVPSSAPQDTCISKWIVNSLLHMSNDHSIWIVSYREWSHDVKIAHQWNLGYNKCMRLTTITGTAENRDWFRFGTTGTSWQAKWISCFELNGRRLNDAVFLTPPLQTILYILYYQLCAVSFSSKPWGLLGLYWNWICTSCHV